MLYDVTSTDPHKPTGDRPRHCALAHSITSIFEFKFNKITVYSSAQIIAVKTFFTADFGYCVQKYICFFCNFKIFYTVSERLKQNILNYLGKSVLQLCKLINNKLVLDKIM